MVTRPPFSLRLRGVACETSSFPPRASEKRLSTRLLVSKDWGGFGIDSEPHIYLENCCIQAIVNYTGTIPLCRQVFQLGALELCLQTLLRKKVWRSEESEIHPDSTIVQSLENALIAVCK